MGRRQPADDELTGVGAGLAGVAVVQGIEAGFDLDEIRGDAQHIAHHLGRGGLMPLPLGKAAQTDHHRPVQVQFHRGGGGVA